MPISLSVEPSKALSRWVRCLWYYRSSEWSHALESVLPTGSAQFLINLREDRFAWCNQPEGPLIESSGTVLQGPRDTPQWVGTDQQRFVAGVVFRPGGIAAFLPDSARVIHNGHVELSDLSVRDAAGWREELSSLSALDALRRIDAELVRLRSRTPASHVLDAAERLAVGVPLDAVVESAAGSVRGFRARFVDAVGLSPKRFAMVQRVQRVCAALRPGASTDWARVAHRFGYADQAHLVRDFHRFAGVSPTRYRPRSYAELNHAVADR